MNDQLHADRCSVENLSLQQVVEAFLQSRLEQDKLKESLNDDQPRKGRQPVILELQFRNGGSFFPHVFSAKLHT